ncbi:MAG: ribonuclease Z [Cyclobacteriaceae bacterium]
MSIPFALTILGSGGALPVQDKNPSCQYLQIGSSGILIDTGEGVQKQLLKFGISHHKINYVFISHLHGDHYLGLMGLLFSMHLSGRKQDLHIWSHTGLDEIIIIQLKHAGSVLSYPVHFHHLEKNKTETILETEIFSVITIPLKHRVPCSGFLFREKRGPYRIKKESIPSEMKLVQLIQLKSGSSVLKENGEVLYELEKYTLPPHPVKSYAYCSDTAPDDTVAGLIFGTDLIYHEATFMTSDEKRAAETFHSTAAQAAEIAVKAGAKKLLIGHISARYKEQSQLLEEAKAIFPNTLIASEGMIVNLRTLGN